MGRGGGGGGGGEFGVLSKFCDIYIYIYIYIYNFPSVPLEHVGGLCHVLLGRI